MGKKYLTREETADLLRCTKYTISRLVKEGKINYVRFGRKILFDPENLQVKL